MLETDHPSRRIIRRDLDHPSSINTGRTMRRTIGVSCDSSRVCFIVDEFSGRISEKAGLKGLRIRSVL